MNLKPIMKFGMLGGIVAFISGLTITIAQEKSLPAGIAAGGFALLIISVLAYISIYEVT